MTLSRVMQAALYWNRKRQRFGPDLSSPFVPGGTGYTVTGADANHAVTFGAGSMRFAGTTLASLTVTKAGALVIGKTYELTIICSAYVSGSVKFGSLGNIIFGGPAGTTKIRGVATAVDFTILQNIANTDITFASISIQEVIA